MKTIIFQTLLCLGLVMLSCQEVIETPLKVARPEPPSDTLRHPTTSAPETTSEVGYFCPSSTQCTTCPEGWTVPNFIEEDVYVGNNSCDVTLLWDFSPYPEDGGPKLGFTCIYSQTGEYCTPNVAVNCASCGNVTFNALSSTLQPVVTYSDNCGQSSTFPIAQNCVEIITIDPDYYCPNSDQCGGCPEGWGHPILYLSGGPLNNNGSCDLTVSWDWEYLEEDGVPNPKMTFQCIYETTGMECSNGTISACASCGEVVFTDVQQDQEPFINFSDTCGDLYQLNIGQICQGTAIYKPY